ncbi:DUF748 domain-containing protein [Ramlibacter monticola]|uniref:DUF748 domain-containing protein n=1 Tax=Ramlibacter monticola TaxID=1926872 RepID=A0A937CUL1_9BURK|nr:DUF748 domain-containing protein [Ramlibacter monticola]MBL0392808.1 DUF748 domain-containing protein [Ramlibacter monticola]
MYWAAGGAGAVAFYAALGFWAVPALVPALAARHAQQELGRELSFGDLRFNPFTLRLEASDVRLRDRDGSDLLAVGQLVAEAQWRSVTRGAWSFAELSLARPALWPRIAPDGDFNFVRLAADLRGNSPPKPDGPPPRLIVEKIAVEDGRVDFDDRRAGFHNVIAPIAFRLDRFSTLPEQSHDEVLSARMGEGTVLRWKSQSSLQPLRAGGELILENAPLPEFSVYLKPFARAALAAGRLDAVVPYTFSYAQGRTEARIAGARVALREVGIAHEGARDSFAALGKLELSGIEADLAQRQASVAQVKASDGRLVLRRDEHGALDLQSLMVQAAGPAASVPVATTTLPADWRVNLPEILLERIALQVTDESMTPPLVLDAGEVGLRLAVAANQVNGKTQVQVSGASLDAARLALASGTHALQMRRLAVSGGSVDLQSRKVGIEKVLLDGVQAELRRRADGTLDLFSTKPRTAAAVRTEIAEQWNVRTGEVALQDSTLHVADEATGLDLQVQDIALAVEGAGTDLAQPLPFRAGLALSTGGRAATKGRMVPATGALEADVQVQDIALAALQPLLAQHVRLKLTKGTASARGKVLVGAAGAPGRAKAPQFQYEGTAHVSGLALHEEDGDLFASWKDVGTERLRASVSPNRLEIPELRVTGAYAKLLIDEDRSINAARLLTREPAQQPAPKPAPVAAKAAAAEAFPVRIHRVRLEDAKVDFTDLSLRPQFAANIYELQGAINGLSTQRDARTQVELDGRVDEFGLARVRGEFSAFAPKEDTDLQVVFRNVNMVPASPYSMKFAGYRIAEGRISLDLGYKVKSGRLEGKNQVVIDRLTLGEQVESPDALKIPLQLALAILTDSNGRIDLGLPVSGSLDDPEFSYAAVVWKALGNVLTKIVTAPFRALGAALGIQSENLDAIEFDPGSAKLLPPEREKLLQVAHILEKRTQLKLAVPAPFSEAADGAALRRSALRADVTRLAGIQVPPGQEPGPIDVEDQAVRVALRDLYAQRFGKEELAKALAPPGQTAPAAAPLLAGATRPATPAQGLAMGAPGEPQEAEAARQYAALQRRLEETQPLPPEALQRLGEQRAMTIVETLLASGVATERASSTPAKAIEGSARSVPVSLELSSR